MAFTMVIVWILIQELIELIKLAQIMLHVPMLITQVFVLDI